MNQIKLYINIGNTNTTFAYFLKNDINNPIFKTILTSELKTDNYKEVIDQVISEFQINFNCVYICSVVNSLNEKIEKYFADIHKKCCFPSHNNFSDIDLSEIYNPFQVGNDILVQSFYVSNFIDEAIVISAGTMCVIYHIKNKKLYGCIILPGISQSIDLIKNKTEINDFNLCQTNKLFGSNTQEAISIGLVNNIEHMVDRLKKELNTECSIICTGGDQQYFKHNNWWFINHLEIIGLYLLSQNNKNKK